MTGGTTSTEATFPVKGGPDLTQNGGYDAFGIKVWATGAGFAYTGFIGGTQDEAGRGIAVDWRGDAYVTGFTYSTEATFPVKGGPDLRQNGSSDGFVVKIQEALFGNYR